eukprot:1190148-Prorocentrum_minimum.AAC.1
MQWSADLVTYGEVVGGHKPPQRPDGGLEHRHLHVSVERQISRHPRTRNVKLLRHPHHVQGTQRVDDGQAHAAEVVHPFAGQWR